MLEILKSVKDEHQDDFVYVVPNLFTKKMKSFMLIREDINFISEITGKLISYKQSANPDEKVCFALWQSVIVTYGKCFTENKAGMSKLEKSMLDTHDEKFQVSHDRLIDLRHSYIAHRDDTEKEQAVVFMKISTDKEISDQTEYLIRARKLMSPGINELKSFLQLFELLKQEVERKIQKHGDKTHSAFLELLTPKQVNMLLINNMKFD